MNNLVNTEKALKHWLKNRATVTTATVVGFLIMGTVSFGANNTEYIIEKDDQINRNITYNNGDPILKITNNGKIIIDNGNNMEAAVRLQEEVKNNSQKELINNGTIIIETTKTAISGVKLLGDSRVTNNGTIAVTSTESGAYGINLTTTKNSTYSKENPAIINNGDIVVNAVGSASGIVVTNNGKIDVPIINNGNITVDATNGNGRVTAIRIGGEKISFENNGTIKLGENVNTEGRIFEIGSTSQATNNGILEASHEKAFISSNFTNSGIIKVNKEEVDSTILNYVKGGTITNKFGIAIDTDSDINMAGDIKASEINKAGDKIVLKSNNTTILGDTSVENKQIEVRNSINSNTVTFNEGTLNFDKNGKLTILENTSTILNGTKVNKVGDNKDALELKKESKLGLIGVTVNDANIIGEGTLISQKETNVKGNIAAESLDIEDGEMFVDGGIKIEKIKVGQEAQIVTDETSIFKLSSNSGFGKETSIWNSSTGVTGTTVFEIGKNGENALNNSTAKVTINGNIDFDTTNLTTDKKVELNNETVKHDLTGANYADKKDGIYTTTLDKANNTLNFAYNKNLFADSQLNAINTEAQIVNDKFSNVVSEREIQIDKLYSESIYAETVRAAYDNLKLNERTILSLNNDVKAGEFKAEGKAIYGKDEYKREGLLGKYEVENETSGLLASLEYGVTDTTKAGLVFAGSKQDLDAAAGNADGDLFYLGLYGVKSVGNYDFTAGLGYQLGKYEANNTVANVLGTDKYDTEAISGYAQAKYLGDLGRGVSIQPKVKLGYTYLKQDDVKDSYFGLTDAEIKTFDTELGVDLVKTIQFEKSTLDVKLGAAYVKTFGDTDKAFRGQFFGENAVSNQFAVLGGELSENVLKFNLGAEVSNENGFFYNGGLTYEFGSENMESYGVTLGAGYKF